jgi:predicted Zn-dependent protease
MLLAGIAVLVGMNNALAGVINIHFHCITHNNSQNCATGENQLQLAIKQVGKYVDFRFINNGGTPSSITDIYFDWPDRHRYDDKYKIEYDKGRITDSGDNVSFSYGASPENLPGGRSIRFKADLGAESEKPIGKLGVNNGIADWDWVNIRIWTNSKTLEEDLHSGALRVGLLVQGFETHGTRGSGYSSSGSKSSDDKDDDDDKYDEYKNSASESFVSHLKKYQVPEPSTLALLGLAFAGIGFATRRRKVFA